MQRRWLIGIAITVTFGVFGAVMAVLAYTRNTSSTTPPARAPAVTAPPVATPDRPTRDDKTRDGKDRDGGKNGDRRN